MEVTKLWQATEAERVVAAVSVFQMADELATIDWNLILQNRIEISRLDLLIMSQKHKDIFEILWRIHGQDHIKNFLLLSKEPLFESARRVIEELTQYIANNRMLAIWQLVRGPKNPEEWRSVHAGSFRMAFDDLCSNPKELERAWQFLSNHHSLHRSEFELFLHVVDALYRIASQSSVHWLANVNEMHSQDAFFEFLNRNGVTVKDDEKELIKRFWDLHAAVDTYWEIPDVPLFLAQLLDILWCVPSPFQSLESISRYYTHA